MSNIFKFSTPIKVATLPSDVSVNENGLIYYNSTDNKFKFIENNTTLSVDFSSILTHIANNSNPHNVTKAQILAGNLITNTDIDTNAAIAESKLALDYSTNSLNSSISLVSTNLTSHINNQTNPHNVTKAQILAGNLITNADIDTNAAIAESKLSLDYSTSILNSNISLVSSDLTSHINNQNNPHNVTKAQILAGNLITNSDIDTNAAIAESKLALDYSTNSLNTAIQARLPLSGGTMSGTIYMNGNNISSLGAPVNPQDAVTKAYVDSLVSGLSWKKPVLSVVSNLPSSPTVGDRYLLNDTVDVNKIAEWNGTTWDYYTPSTNWAVFVADVDAGYTYDDNSLDNFKWIQFTGTGQIEAGVGLNKSGNILSVKLGAGIGELPTGEVGIELSTISGLYLTDSTSGGTLELADSIAGNGLLINNKVLSVSVDNNTIEINTNNLRIKNEGITNNHISASAAIAENKLALDYPTATLYADINTKANQSLNNITGIQSSLVPDTNLAWNIGSNTAKWNTIFADSLSINNIGFPNNSQINEIINKLDISSDSISLTANEHIYANSNSAVFYDKYYHNIYIPTGQTTVLTDLSFDRTQYCGIIVDYIIKLTTAGEVRNGVIRVAASNDNTESASIAEQYVESSNIAITFDTNNDNNTVQVRAIAGSIGETAVLMCRVTRIPR